MSCDSHATMRKVMPRKLFLAIVLVTAGFIGGLLLTARLHITSDSSASDAGDVLALPATAAPPPGAEQARPVPTAAPSAAISSAGPDFTRVAGQAVKGVANISSLQVARTSNSPFAADPFFRYFFGEQDDVFGLPCRARQVENVAHSFLIARSWWSANYDNGAEHWQMNTTLRGSDALHPKPAYS